MTISTPVVGLLPLDDRPVNTSHVAGIARVAGARVLLPPDDALPPRGVPGDLERLSDWLISTAPQCDALVVSINQLSYGGFVASRRTGDSITTALRRLDVLGEIRAAHPALPIYAFMTLMRTKNRDDAGAEPEYWDRHGRDFFALSTELYRAEHGLAADVTAAREAIPEPIVVDYFTRRLRLHAVHLAGMELALTGTIDYLAITVEDSVVQSVSTSEREWLQAWIRRLGLGERVRCYPGADEAAAVLTARALLAVTGRTPTAAVTCAEPEALDRVALYEDVPVAQTIAAQLRTAGLTVIDDASQADLVVAIHPPGAPSRDWCSWPDVPERRPDGAEALADQVAKLLADGSVVTVADVADANGSDPHLITALRCRGLLETLGGFGGWNTAGNAIGSAVAQGCARLLAGNDTEHLREHMRQVTHRLVEDWGYQSAARCAVLTGSAGTELADHRASVAEQLAERLGELGPLASRFQLAEHTVRFPWNRSFEIDFELVHRDESAGQG